MVRKTIARSGIGTELPFSHCAAKAFSSKSLALLFSSSSSSSSSPAASVAPRRRQQLHQLLSRILCLLDGSRLAIIATVATMPKITAHASRPFSSSLPLRLLLILIVFVGILLSVRARSGSGHGRNSASAGVTEEEAARRMLGLVQVRQSPLNTKPLIFLPPTNISPSLQDASAASVKRAYRR
jgi:hypothetical protein